MLIIRIESFIEAFSEFKVDEARELIDYERVSDLWSDAAV